MIALRRPGLPKSAILLIGTLSLLAADVVVHGKGETPAAVVLAVVLILLGAWVASHWSWLVAGLVIVVVLIPSDGRYTLGGGLPFQLEPYRVFVALVLVGWIAALLSDRRVKLRRTGFEGPLALILFAIVGSDVLNPGRISGITSFVIKSLSLEASFLLIIYMVMSVVRERRVLESIMKVLVVAGCLEAIGAIVQRKLNYNPFDHLHLLLPIFRFNVVLVANNVRGGTIRATASAGHPIELSATMAMLLPFAIYLAVKRRHRMYWVAAVLLLAGDFAGGSRTGLISILVMLAVFLWLRPRETLRCWPALIPLLLIVHFLDPGALGGLYEGFFPQGGIVAQQSQTFIGPGGVQENANRLSRVGPELQNFENYNPLFGEGFGTRVTGRTSLTAAQPTGVLDYAINGQSNPTASEDNAEILDDQWLGTLLETGILGIAGWVWMFVRLIRRLGARAKLERGSPDGWLPVALAAAAAGFASSMFFYDAFAYTQATFLMHLLIGCTGSLLALPAATAASRPRMRVVQS